MIKSIEVEEHYVLLPLYFFANFHRPDGAIFFKSLSAFCKI
ncbi:MAG: hypothetical protein ACRCTF_04080 [Bacteroidales bacterium]